MPRPYKPVPFMRDDLDLSIEAAIEAGALDERRHAALISSARLCAYRIDGTDEPTAALLTSMLNHLRALGLAPTNADIDRRRRVDAGAPNKLDELRARHAWSKMEP